MFCISVHFLCGEFIARTAQRTSEWPPHPARLLYALIAAWYEGKCQTVERESLYWLESQNAPDILAEADAPVESYEAWVPMNSVPNWDKKGGKRPTLPKEKWVRSSRYVGDDPVKFVWDVDIPPIHQQPLQDLCNRCTRLGSSESLVAITVGHCDSNYGSAWRPTSSGTMLRVPMPGLLDSIQTANSLTPGRILPCDWETYRWMNNKPSQMITFAITHGNCAIEFAPSLANRLRQSLIAMADANQLPLLPILHGHEENGDPLRRLHLQICPLPFVGFRHATGAVLGVSFILPQNTSDTDRLYVDRVVATWYENGALVNMSGGRVIKFGPPDSRFTLTDARWTKVSDLWQTVVPLELPRHVSKHKQWNQSDWKRVSTEIVRACSQSDLPTPLELEVSNVPYAVGSPSPRTVRGPHRRPIVHARLLFPYAVAGPIVIGAGRHLGYGLMEPLDSLS